MKKIGLEILGPEKWRSHVIRLVFQPICLSVCLSVCHGYILKITLRLFLNFCTLTERNIVGKLTKPDFESRFF